MGISFKIFPGVRVGVTRRGFNASVGPRIARIHAGPGGVRYSSGLGPLTVSGGGGRGRRRSYSRGGGLDWEAFDAVMRVTDEQKAARLQAEIERLKKKGWKLDKQESFSASMTRPATQKRKLTWVFIVGTVFLGMLGRTIDQVSGLRAVTSDEPIWASVVTTIIFGLIFGYQIYSFSQTKSAKRKFEVGDYGVLHKHYHG